MKIRRGGTISDDVIDKRAETRAAGGRAGLSLPGGAKGGIGGIILMLILALLGGSQLIGGGSGSGNGGLGDILGQIVNGVQPPGALSTAVPGAPDPQADTVEFVTYVLDDIQDSWTAQFQASGSSYERAKLVLFEQGVQTGGCGFAPSEVGPFYCPADKTVYLDLSFFDDLATKYKAPGDFAQAYVIAHEVGHHVQNLTGVSDAVRKEQQSKPKDANELSVRLELQADCLAGVWAHNTYENVVIERGDIDAGLAAAAAVGDDRLQKQAGVEVNPDTWTHGSSEQRKTWFTTGYESGNANSCDTFSGGI
ncbi:MAG: neutral zinc metallopeptidase [Dehalococcoidia bacterium]